MLRTMFDVKKKKGKKKTSVRLLCDNVHCYTLNLTKSSRQQSEQSCPDLSLPQATSSSSSGGSPGVPKTVKEIISPACPGSASGSPPNRTCLKHLHRESSGAILDRCLNHLNPLLNDQAPHTIFMDTPSHHVKKKIISAAFICSIVLSVSSFSPQPGAADSLVSC